MSGDAKEAGNDLRLILTSVKSRATPKISGDMNPAVKSKAGRLLE